ncbi:MAG: AAA family ATPase [Candidatus Woesearchaeota archaeon]
MSDLWYKDLGFKENPFSIKPAALHDEVIAYDLEEIYDKVEYGDVMFVEGPFGMGKSTILKNIINEFGGDRRIVYYSANRAEGANFRKAINDTRGFIGKLFNTKPKDIVLLVDEADHLTEKDFDKLKDLYEDGVVKSLVFVGPNFDEMKMSDYFADLVKDNVISLTELDEDEAVSLIRSRVGDTDFISDEIIKKIYLQSERNPRILLKNAEDVCRYAFEFGDDRVLEEHIEELFSKK